VEGYLVPKDFRFSIATLLSGDRGESGDYASSQVKFARAFPLKLDQLAIPFNIAEN